MLKYPGVKEKKEGKMCTCKLYQNQESFTLVMAAFLPRLCEKYVHENQIYTSENTVTYLKLFFKAT